ncbi:MAG: hypothetical protein DMG12_18760 [Acidobacteria bacterium]|nr:MAG: hypothetical protein DMG12_18760 [Acidobacteriota bacterium]
MYLAFYIASFFGNYDLSRYLWEKIRPLDTLPDSYRKRYTNAQALLGIKMLERIDALNALNRAHAETLTEGLKGIESIQPAGVLSDTSPVYYQYCIRTSDPATLAQHAIRHGIDVEIMHVDVCNRLSLFARYEAKCPVAEGTEHTLQLPVYAALSERDLERIIHVIRQAVCPPGRLAPTIERSPR